MLDNSDILGLGFAIGLAIGALIFVTLNLVISSLKKKLEREDEYLSTLDDKSYRKYVEYKRNENKKSLE